MRYVHPSIHPSRVGQHFFLTPSLVPSRGRVATAVSPALTAVLFLGVERRMSASYWGRQAHPTFLSSTRTETNLFADLSTTHPTFLTSVAAIACFVSSTYGPPTRSSSKPTPFTQQLHLPYPPNPHDAEPYCCSCSAAMSHGTAIVFCHRCTPGVCLAGCGWSRGSFRDGGHTSP